MAKFCGEVGYGETVEKPLGGGVYKLVITERKHRGDVTRTARRLQESERLNDDLSLGNSIEIVADPYAKLHMHDIRYVKWQGALWRVTDVEARYPRLILRLGGVYNGPVPDAPATTP